MDGQMQHRYSGAAGMVAHLLFAMMMLSSKTLAQPTNEPPPAHWPEGLETKLADMGLSIDKTNATRATTLAVVQTIDPQARLLEAGEWEDIQQRRQGWGYFSGIGLGMSNGVPVIREVLPGSGAASAGLMAGDVITGIGTTRLDRTSLPDVQSMLRSENEASLSVTYLRSGSTNSTGVTLTRGQEPAIALAELLPNGAGYLNINGLYQGSGRDVVSHIRAWSETGGAGLILDLRGAGGDDETSVMQVASLFAHAGQFLFAYRDHLQQDLQVFEAVEGKSVELPVMVLINRETTGASEVLAAVLNSVARRALMIGEPSAGDYNLRAMVPLAGSSLLMVTRVLDTGDGWRYNGQFGIQPSLVISPEERGTHDYEPPEDLLDRRQRLEVELRDAALRRRVRGDGVLERALDIITGLKSLNNGSGEVSSPEP